MQEHVSLGYVAQGSWNVGNLFEYCNHSWGREKMKERRAKAEKSFRIGGRFDCNFLIELGRGKDLHFPSPDGLSETEQVKKKSRIPS